MSRKILLLAALAVLGAACTDGPVFNPGESQDPLLAPGTSPGIPTETLARLVARALRDDQFRTYLYSGVQASPYAEHKVQFQRLIAAAHARGLADAQLATEAARLPALEIYLPVPEHRAAWTGGTGVLVATAETDHQNPVAFDTEGRRLVLDAETPPRVPVLALVPVETDFNAAPRRVECIICDDGGGGGTGDPAPAPVPGLYMAASSFVSDFEGWLKGKPEFEVHILGQKGQTDSLVDYQCSGEQAAWPYAFNQDARSWTGSVLLFSEQQFAAYHASHPGQNVRVFLVEDDDTPCEIKAGRDLFNDLLKSIDDLFKSYTAGRDSTDASGRTFRNANALQKVWSAAAAFLKSNDELVGNAVEDDVARTYKDGYNWIVKGKDNVTNGWVKLEMK